MYEVAIMGGGFDPVCLHHERMAADIYSKTGLTVWMMPCYSHKFSKNSRLLSPEHRLKMLELTIIQRQDFAILPFDWEIEKKSDGAMYETVASIKAQPWEPEFKFRIVIGMDNANIIEEKWDRGKLLISENPFIVMERPGVTPTAKWFLNPPHLVLPTNDEANLSSTTVRDAIEQGNYEFAEQHLNPAVWDYIKANQLYGYKP